MHRTEIRVDVLMHAAHNVSYYGPPLVDTDLVVNDAHLQRALRPTQLTRKTRHEARRQSPRAQAAPCLRLIETDKRRPTGGRAFSLPAGISDAVC